LKQNQQQKGPQKFLSNMIYQKQLLSKKPAKTLESDTEAMFQTASTELLTFWGPNYFFKF